MDKQLTASEVRNWERAYKGTGAAKVFGAFADLLEADEKAVPVRQFRVVPKGSTWTDVKDDEIWATVTAHPESYETRILYTRPPPADADWKNNVLAGDMKAIVDGDGNVLYVNKASFDQQVHKTDDALATVSALTADAERLAEALQPFANLFQALYAAVPDDWPVYGINKTETTAGDLRRANEALAAHSAKAQPPAASVTAAMVNRLACWMIAQFGECRAPVDHKARIEWWGNQARSALEAALAARENPNG